MFYSAPTLHLLCTCSASLCISLHSMRRARTKTSHQQEHLALRPPISAVEQTWTADDIYDNASDEIIRKFSEDQRVERKPARCDPRQLGDYFSIYANRAPQGGVVFVGVADNGDIEGCSRLDDKRLDELEQAGRTYCPDARYDSKRVPVYTATGKADFILAFRIAYRADKLVETTRGEAFTRIGSSKKRLSELEKREIRIGKREIDFESEDVPLEWPAAFDLDLVHTYTASYAARRRLSGQHSTQEILAVSHLGRLGKSGFVPNIACTLLFAKDPRRMFPGARIRVLRFDGTRELTGSQRNEISDEWLDGPIPHLISKAEEYIADQLQGLTRLGESGRFGKESVYPRDAWREAIVNACVHRSYNLRNMPVFVRLFDDKITVESPGGFPPPTTSRTVYDSHNPRNPFVMEALFYLDFVKCAHEGARRMRDLMVEAKLPEPEFSEVDLDGYLVRVTLRGGASTEATPVARELPLSANEKRLLKKIGPDGISVSGAGQLLKVQWRTAKKLLDGLVEKGLVVRHSASGKPKDPTARYYPKT